MELKNKDAPKSSMPHYNYEEEEAGVYDFGDEDYVNEEDLMDLDELDDVQLEID